MNFSGRSVRLANRVIEIDDVLDVKIVSGFKCGSTLSKIFCFTLSSSVAASMIKSDVPNSVKSSVVLIRPIAELISSSEIFPLRNCRSMFFLTRSTARSNASWFTSFSKTE